MPSLEIRATVPAPGPDHGARGRTYRLLLAHAMEVAKSGRLVTVAEVAAAAGVSRATAYRYFGSRSELVSNIVEESLGSVRRFESSATDGRARLQELFSKTFPRFQEFEPHMRAALQLALEHWARERAGTLHEEPYRRGHRARILAAAAAPLKREIGNARFERLLRALSLIYGIESYVVLKDIWGASNRQVEEVARWMADALVDAALADAGALPRSRVKNQRTKERRR
jgi:AcrR family transcriptional regulator